MHYHLPCFLCQKPRSHFWWLFLLCPWQSINHQVLSSLPPEIDIASLHFSALFHPFPRSLLYGPCLKIQLATIGSVADILQNKLLSKYSWKRRNLKSVARWFTFLRAPFDFWKKNCCVDTQIRLTFGTLLLDMLLFLLLTLFSFCISLICWFPYKGCQEMFISMIQNKSAFLIFAMILST